MNKAKGHPFRSTFVPNGEESRPLPREGNRRAAVEGYRLSRSLIGADGVPRDIVVRKTIPAGDLTTVAASAVKDMRYVAGSKNPAHEPVFTYLVIPFNLPADPAERKKITDACVLKDFPRGYR